MRGVMPHDHWDEAKLWTNLKISPKFPESTCTWFPKSIQSSSFVSVKNTPTDPKTAQNGILDGGVSLFCPRHRGGQHQAFKGGMKHFHLTEFGDGLQSHCLQ